MNPERPRLRPGAFVVQPPGMKRDAEDCSMLPVEQPRAVAVWSVLLVE